MATWCGQVVHYGATWHSFKHKLEKIKKNHHQKKFLYFNKWNFVAPRLKSTLYFGKCNFLYPRLKAFLYFLRKAFLIFQEREPF